MSKSRRTGRRLRCPVALAAAFLCVLAGVDRAAESNPESNSPPDAPSEHAVTAVPEIRLKPGFRLELVAQDPAIAAPVAMAFDENGRLFVVERPEGPVGGGVSPRPGRIRVLEDTEGEGQFNTSTVYATNLPLASALACYNGGVFVLAGPELLYLKDTKTNGVADVRQVIFAGIAITNRANEPALANNFHWGLDNRIHAASAGGAGLVPGSEARGAGLVSLTRADFSFDPRGLTITAEAGPSLSGLSFDDWGRKFSCDPLRPLRTAMYEPRYLARNPFFPAPGAMVDAASAATMIFRAAPAATNPTNRAVVPDTKRLAATWLTNAQACVVYRGSAFPSAYAGNAFVADPSAHVIHRFVLRESGLDVTAIRPPDEAATEFAISADKAFRPVQLVNGPDGALYVLDRRDGNDRGRIYRIVPSEFKRPKPPRLGKATTYGLVAMLSHPNGWHRDTAARLLYERRDPGAVPLLQSVLAESRWPLARLHALHALAGLNALSQSNVLLALRDRDPRIREHAVRLAERLVGKDGLPEAVWNQLRSMTDDPSLRVRYQLAFTIGNLHRPNVAPLLAALLVRDPTNSWIQAAVFSSLAEGAGDLFLALARDGRVRRDPLGQRWLQRLAEMIGVKGTASEVAQVVGFVEPLQNESLPAFALLYALGDGLHWTRSSLGLVDDGGRLRPFFAQAMNALLSPNLSVTAQTAAIRLLSVGPYGYANAGDLLLLQLGSGQPAVVQAAALAALGRLADPRIVPSVVQRWRLLTPSLRTAAFSALLARDERVAAVMTALENGTVDAADLSPSQMNFLRSCRDAAVRQRALKLFGPVSLENPKATQPLRPALSLRASAMRGREIFNARCAACHGGNGGTPSLGPDLAAMRIYGKEAVLQSILEPNAAVRPDYPTYVVETQEGENLVGVMRDEDGVTITLQTPSGGPIILPRDNILYLQSEPWSLMPERLEAGLTVQNMADLLEYVVTAAP